jgi:hypothetical protein
MLAVSSLRHDANVPDDLDYAWLGWLIENPADWSCDDLSAAEQILVDQKRAVDESHPSDLEGRRAKQALVDHLEAAIAAYHDARPD